MESILFLPLLTQTALQMKPGTVAYQNIQDNQCFHIKTSLYFYLFPKKPHLKKSCLNIYSIFTLSAEHSYKLKKGRNFKNRSSTWMNRVESIIPLLATKCQKGSSLKERLSISHKMLQP